MFVFCVIVVLRIKQHLTIHLII